MRVTCKKGHAVLNISGVQYITNSPLIATDRKCIIFLNCLILTNFRVGKNAIDYEDLYLSTSNATNNTNQWTIMTETSRNIHILWRGRYTNLQTLKIIRLGYGIYNLYNCRLFMAFYLKPSGVVFGTLGGSSTILLKFEYHRVHLLRKRKFVWMNLYDKSGCNT